jgi:hypothetical protein
LKRPAEGNDSATDFQTLLSSFRAGIAILERTVKFVFLRAAIPAPGARQDAMVGVRSELLTSDAII